MGGFDNAFDDMRERSKQEDRTMARMNDDREILVTYDMIKYRTQMAVLFVIGDKEVWLPNSQIVDIFEGDNQVVVSERVAIDKGLV